MASEDLSSLVKEVLLGKPEETKDYSSVLQELHKSLKKTDVSSISGSLKLAETLLDQKKLAESDFEIFKNYLSNIQTSEEPKLLHLPIVNSGHRVSLLCHALNKIQLKSQSTVHTAFNSLNLRKVQSINSLELKRINCARLIATLRSSVGIRMQKTVDLLNFETTMIDFKEKYLDDNVEVIEKLKKTKTVKKTKLATEAFEPGSLELLASKAQLFANGQHLAVLK